MEPDKSDISLPDEIQKKLDASQAEVRGLIKEADLLQQTKLEGKISFSYRHSAPSDILTPFERAQSVCFITRYEHLPVLDSLDIAEIKGKYYLNNIPYIRHMLNEYRSIIVNVKDSIHYGKIHKFCYEKLSNKDPSRGLSITVKHEKQDDVTDTFRKILGEKNAAMKLVLKKSEFNYIYNGILQHSDHQYTKRFWEEYFNGKLNYIFIKHAMLLEYIKGCLFWHYKILNQLTFPKMGPL